jgi:FKBP-type peptidyl-prolyl cis-trans isomerase
MNKQTFIALSVVAALATVAHAQMPSMGKAADAMKAVDTAKSTADTAKSAADTAKSATAMLPASKVVTTASGLKYEDVKVGTGAEAKAGQNASVHYTGWLWVDGKRGNKFDSSKDRGQPFSFPLGGGRVIKGWDEGVQGMKIGGTRLLTIPPAIGYGERGAGADIPPNSTLQFEVELLGVQ